MKKQIPEQVTVQNANSYKLCFNLFSLGPRQTFKLWIYLEVPSRVVTASTQSPFPEPVFCLSAVSCRRKMAVQHGGLCRRGPDPSIGMKK